MGKQIKMTDRWKLDTGMTFYDEDGTGNEVSFGKDGVKKRYDFIEEVTKADRYDHIEEIEKFNPYHDARGRFTSANGATSFTYAPGKSKAHDMAIERERGKHISKVAADLVSKAKENEPKMTETLMAAAKETGGELVGLDYRIKSESSLARKIKTEMNENGLSAEAAAGKMKDVNRYTMQFGEDNFTTGYNATMKALEKQGYEIVVVKNSIADPTAEYRGINTNIKNKDGSIWELQFHTAKSLEIKEVNHKLYEEQRLDNTPPERRAALGAEMAKNASSIPTPAGSETIKPFNKLK